MYSFDFMHLFFIGLVCFVCFYEVTGEFCTHVSNCTKEFCPSGKSHLACQSHFCTCDADLIAIPCVLENDCDGKGICLQPNTTQKCYSGYCQCVFNIDLPDQPGSVVG